MMHSAATGVISSPWEHSSWGQKLAVAVRAPGPERDHKKEGMMGAFKALVECLEFNG